jgi:hypothetical protein
MFEHITNLPAGSASVQESFADVVFTVGSRETALRLALNVLPWADQGLAPEERYTAYVGFLENELTGINEALGSAHGDDARYNQILEAQETKQLLVEMELIGKMSPEEFCREMDSPERTREILRKNVLGADAWRSLGVDVGAEPQIPASIMTAWTIPGFKDDFLLVLKPATVNGEQFTPLELDRACASKQVEGESLIYGGWSGWKSEPWASAPQAQSEWVLLPIHKPDPKGVGNELDFSGKSIAAQTALQTTSYLDYRQATASEIITAAFLDRVVNGEGRMLANGANLRTVEANSCGAQVTISQDGERIKIADFYVGLPHQSFGRALAWKL